MDLARLSLAELLALQSELHRARVAELRTRRALADIAWHAARARDGAITSRMALRMARRREDHDTHAV